MDEQTRKAIEDMRAVAHEQCCNKCGRCMTLDEDRDVENSNICRWCGRTHNAKVRVIRAIKQGELRSWAVCPKPVFKLEDDLRLILGIKE